MNWKIFIDKKIWKHIGIITISLIVLLIITFMLFGVYTQHGKSKPVPDFTGLTEVQLQHLIKSNNLRYSIIDSVHIDNLPKGVVIEQEPKAGENVKKNRKLFFTINAWSEELVAIPRVIDLSLRDAKVLIESFGLTVGNLIYIPSEYTNLVLGQHYQGKPVEPGTTVSKKSKIDLLIGQGLSRETTAVPNLIGLKLSEAKRITQSVYLNVGATIYDDSVISHNDSINAIIWKQNPHSHRGTTRRLGASIDIWLTNDQDIINSSEEGNEKSWQEREESQQSVTIDDELF